jgi:peptidoglycan hydrolase-like protein with peptidoglycan-binding domain
MSGGERERGELEAGEAYDDWFDEPEPPSQPRRRGQRRGLDEGDDAWVMPEARGARRAAPREPIVIGGRTVTPRQLAIVAGSAIVLLLAILASAGVFSGSSKQSTPPIATTTPATTPTTTTPATTPTTTTPAAKPSVAAPTTTLKPGDTGPQVKALQKALTSLGYSVTVDGSYGPATKTAVASFQTAQGLSADGIVGPQTLTALKTALAGTGGTSAGAAAQAPTTTLKPGDSGAEVVRLQRTLTALGHSPGKADGYYGSATQQAVTAFQKEQGLSADGVVGPQTLTALQSALQARG